MLSIPGACRLRERAITQLNAYLIHVNVAPEVVRLHKTSLLLLLLHVPQVDKVDFARKLVNHVKDVILLAARVAADAHGEPVVNRVVRSYNFSVA